MAKYLDNPDDYVGNERPQDPRVTLNATEARQGSWGRPALYVLLGGLILAMVAWWAAEYFGTAIAPETTDPATTSSTTQDPIANEKTIDDNQPAGEKIQPAPTIQDSNKL